MPDAGEARLAVEVVYALPARCWRLALDLAAGSTVSDAVTLFERDAACPHPIDPADGIAIFGKPVEPSTRLRHGDRVELLRPLAIDPKQKRRERARLPRS